MLQALGISQHLAPHINSPVIASLKQNTQITLTSLSQVGYQRLLSEKSGVAHAPQRAFGGNSLIEIVKPHLTEM